MFDSIKWILRSFFKQRRRNAASAFPAPRVRAQSHQHSGTSQCRPSGIRGGSIHGMRDQIINAEHDSRVHSASHKSIRILKAGGQNPTASTNRAFTEEGLSTAETDYLFETAEGRLVHAPELHGGGACSYHGCRGLTDKLYFCPLCRRGYCETHALQWQDVRVCPEHYRLLRFHEDTWTNG